MPIIVLHIALICLTISATLVAAHNLTDAEVLAFDVPNELKKSFPYFLSGYDEDGAPIWIFELGKWDMRQYAEQGGEIYEAMDIMAHQMFLTFTQSALNSSAKEFVCICNMDDFNIRQAGHPKTLQFIIQQFVRIGKILQDGSLKRTYYVNTNTLFEGILNVGIPLAGTSKSSYEIYGNNRAIWIPKLLKELPKDQLPERYGGFPDHKPVKTYGG